MLSHNFLFYNCLIMFNVISAISLTFTYVFLLALFDWSKAWNENVTTVRHTQPQVRGDGYIYNKNLNQNKILFSEE